MDFIAETEKFNQVKSNYENLIRNYFDENAVREIINNRCVTDSIYRRLESINIYNDFDEKFIGRYDVDIVLNGGMGNVDLIILTGYYWNEDLSGTQTNKQKNPIKFNIFEFLDSINSDLSQLIRVES